MLSRAHEFDITNTVNLEEPASVADAVCHVLHKGFGALGVGEAFLRQAFADIELAFWGKYPGLLHCDTPYHDLRHSLDTALLVARMADGWQQSGEAPLSADDAVLAVALGLFHDIGFIRQTGEEHLVGAQLLRQHENRSVEFVRQYLKTTCFADQLDWADLIQATNFSAPLNNHISTLALAVRPTARVVACLIGSADLISQLADRFYLERCRDFLYREFLDAGADRARTPNGEVVLLYQTGVDLLEKTPQFYENLVRQRLEDDFAGVARVLSIHFGGHDPYQESIQRNLTYLTGLIADGSVDEGLRRHPVPLMPHG